MTEKKQSISAIREIFAAASETELPALYLEYEEDSRAGVQNLIQKYQKQEEALKKERERTEQMKIYEHKYRRGRKRPSGGPCGRRCGHSAARQ